MALFHEQLTYLHLGVPLLQDLVEYRTEKHFLRTMLLPSVPLQFLVFRQHLVHVISDGNRALNRFLKGLILLLRVPILLREGYWLSSQVDVGEAKETGRVYTVESWR